MIIVFLLICGIMLLIGMPWEFVVFVFCLLVFEMLKELGGGLSHRPSREAVWNAENEDEDEWLDVEG